MILGITGGIGSGKSTLCRLLVEHAEAELYDADLRARDLMNRDEALKKRLCESFGEECYNGKGELNRGYLSGQVFGKADRLALLNSTVHPCVRRDFKSWCEQRGEALLILESAILFESGFDDLVDIKVAVLAPQQLRIERVMKRDGLSREQIINRIEAQASDDELQRRADMCVVNIFEDDLESSAQRVKNLAEQWQK